MIERLKVGVRQGTSGWVAEHHEPVAISQNASQDVRFKSFNELPEDSYEAFLSVPILSRGRRVGVINLQHGEPHTYSRRQIRLVSMIGFLVSKVTIAKTPFVNAELMLNRIPDLLYKS